MMSSLLRRAALQPAARRAFHTSRVSCMAEGFKWQHLVTPYSNPDFSTRMRSIEQTLQAMKAELSGIPEKIDPIDWSAWEEKIDDHAMIQQIKSSYENFKPEAGTVDVTAFNAELDKAISRASQTESVITEMVTKYKSELSTAQKEKEDIHQWHFHDYLRRYPGLAEQMRAEYMEGYQLPKESLERLTESDLVELRRTVRNGGKLSSDEDIPTKVGDFDYEVELKKTEEFARKLFGDSPQLKDIQQIIAHELLAVKQIDETHTEEEEHH